MDCLSTQDPDTIPQSTHTPCFALLLFKPPLVSVTTLHDYDTGHNISHSIRVYLAYYSSRHGRIGKGDDKARVSLLGTGVSVGIRPG